MNKFSSGFKKPLWGGAGEDSSAIGAVNLPN
jgi:hypothetical protein